ncbi:hypothetical protein P3W45_001576 [Vairimorpha bombi]|jgi:crossover junction endonuclease MUS81
MLINEIIIDKIKSLLDLASKSNSKTKFIYRKILNEFKKIDTPILSKTQIKNIPNVGEKTAEILFAHIDNVLREKIKDLNELEIYILLLNNTTYNEIKNRLTGNILKVGTERARDDSMSDNSDIDMISIVNKTESQPTKKREISGTRKYVPAYRSGGYAILKALWLENGISKHKIIHIAKNYTNTEFDLTSRNSAWSSIKTLIKKDLVYKESGSKKYFLTLDGQNLSNKLFKDTSIIMLPDTPVTLLIDSREIKNRNHRSFFQNYFVTKNVSHDTRNLEVGDFAWIKNEMICDYIIERKCGSDFVSSISDGRFKEQKRRLRDTGISNIFYLIENLRNSDFKNINSEFGFYCLTSTKLENFIVLETDEIKETATVIEKIDERVRNEFSEENEDFKRSYGSFIEKGTKNRNMTVNHILYYSFIAIYGINHDKATKLSNHFRTLNNFYKAASSDKLKDELSCSKFTLTKKNIEDIIYFMNV